MITHRIAVAGVALVLMLGVACGDDTGSDGGSDAGAQTEVDLTEVVCPADAVELSDGLCYVEHEVGEGPEPEKGDVIEVHYTGKLNDDKVFDSSEGGSPIEFAFGVGQVIEGWDKGLEGMKVGGSRTLIIPGDLAYGEAGYPAPEGGVDIPPNATLTFDVELVSITSGGD